MVQTTLTEQQLAQIAELFDRIQQLEVTIKQQGQYQQTRMKQLS